MSTNRSEFFALVLPASADVKQFRDRVLYFQGIALVFETFEDAQAFLTCNHEYQVAEIAPINLSEVSPTSSTGV